VSPNEILRHILERHPDIKQAHIDEIMDWAQFGTIPPYLVTQLLASMKDVSRHTAELIGHKYQMALASARGEKPPSFPPAIGLLQQQGGAGAPLPLYPQQTPYWPSHWQDVIEILRNHERERELEEYRRKIRELEEGGRGQAKGRGLTLEDLQRLLEERERQRRSEEEKNALMQTLDGVRRALDNLNLRVSAIEQGGTKKPEEGDSFNKRIMDAISKDIADRISGAKGELKPEDIRRIIGDEVRRFVPPPPTGKRNQYDMEVERAIHEAEARKIEAEERRRAYEAIAAGIRDGFASLGWNIGAGVSGAAPGPASQPRPGGAGTGSAVTAEQQPMEWRDGVWHTRCPYSDCRAPLAFEDGQSTVLCPSCNRVINVQPAEEVEKEERERGRAGRGSRRGEGRW